MNTRDSRPGVLFEDLGTVDTAETVERGRRVLRADLEENSEATGGARQVIRGRALQALSWVGHPVAVLAARLCEDELALCGVLHGQVTTVRAGLATAVRDLSDDLWDVPGSSGPAADFAVRHGRVPPLAWDEPGDRCAGHAEPGDCAGHDIEDPAAVPVPGWQRRRLTAAERLADIAEVMPSRSTRQESAWRLGVSRGHADTPAIRAGRSAGGAA